jgi:hypothetical protein
MFNGKIHYKWSFSIAMLNYQRVIQVCDIISFTQMIGKKCGELTND